MARRKHAGVWEGPNGLWGVDYRTPDGRRHKYLVGPKQLAIDIHRARKAEIFEGRYRPKTPDRILFPELVKEALETWRGHLSDETWHNEQYRTGRLEQLLRNDLVDKINAHRVNQVLTTLYDGGKRSGGTVNLYRVTLSKLLGYALEAGKIANNPITTKTVKPYPQAKGRIRYLTADEELALRQVIQQICPWRELEFDLALCTGLRQTEQYTATWQKVDLANRFMTVLGKSRGHLIERTIKLNPLAVKTLEKLYLQSAGSSYVIPHRCRRKAGRKKDRRQWFPRVVKLAGVENCRWHDLRHTFASRAVMAGVPLATLKEWMGHKSIKTTMIYAHLSPEHHEDQMEKFVDYTSKLREPMDTGKDKRNSTRQQVLAITAS